MKLTYTIPALTIPDAADLEAFLMGRGFEFHVAPFQEPAPPAKFQITADAPAKRKITRHKLSQREVMAIHARLVEDDAAHRRSALKDYGREFGVSETTISRIFTGLHPMLPDHLRAKEKNPAAPNLEEPPADFPPPLEPAAGAGVMVLELAQ